MDGPAVRLGNDAMHTLKQKPYETKHGTCTQTVIHYQLIAEIMFIIFCCYFCCFDINNGNNKLIIYTNIFGPEETP